METICFVLIYAVLSQNQFVLPFTLFCREINFVAIHAFLHGEKFRHKLCLWRKKDKYQVLYDDDDEDQDQILCVSKCRWWSWMMKMMNCDVDSEPLKKGAKKNIIENRLRT